MLTEKDIPTTPVLRPSQVDDMRSEIGAIEHTLRPGNSKLEQLVKAQIDKRELARQAQGLAQTLETQSPKVIASEDMAAAVEIETTLRDRIASSGMPTAAEMRKNPSGAVDKHLGWQDRTTTDMLRWKNLRLMLQASGHDFGGRRAGDSVADFEPYRPVGGAMEMPMDNAQIPGRYYMMPGPSFVPGNTMPESEAAFWSDWTQRMMAAQRISDASAKAQAISELVGESMTYSTRAAEPVKPVKGGGSKPN